MENKKRKSTGLLLSILGVISLVLITAGVTYAFFSYARQGETVNSITTGTITFAYNESENALEINNALPQADSVGIASNATSAFEFSVTSTTPSTAYINYIVTARMGESTLPQNQVKLYLTVGNGSSADGTNGNVTTGVTMLNNSTSVKTFAELPNATDNAYNSILKTSTIGSGVVEKVLYVGQVPARDANNNGSYTKNFRLNMWLKGAEEGGSTEGIADYSAFEFVKKTSATGTGPISISSFVENTDWMRSVPYYSGLEAATPTVTASDWTRIAWVNYETKQIYTKEQADAAGFVAPDTSAGWVESEQYYPLNGGTFTVTINVYAEGATTYQVPNANNNG